MMQEKKFDLAIVGAGPAGMRAAICATEAGLAVVVLDSQDEPGGQIWRWVKRNAGHPIMDVLGRDYSRGNAVVQQFLTCGATFISSTQVNRIQSGWAVEYLRDGKLHTTYARSLLLAAGAQERPVPFKGWTMPGVMTVGAAQILLKTARQLPKGPVVVAGNGPLPLLYQYQLLKAGGKPSAYLETTPSGMIGRSLAQGRNALQLPAQLWKGMKWLPRLQTIRRVGDVSRLVAKGTGQLEAVYFETGSGRQGEIEASTLLVHEGLVPNHQLAVAAGARIVWDAEQSVFRVGHDDWMAARPDNLFVAGDGVRIGGAVQAELEGELAALGVLRKIGLLTEKQAKHATVLQRKNAEQSRFRSFLDAVYPPRLATAAPENDTLICRCEERCAGDIREAIRYGECKGPNQLKAFTRVGMGPCQGRQCSYSVHQLLKTATGLPADDVGLFRARPPFAPITVGALAAQENDKCLQEPSHE